MSKLESYKAIQKVSDSLYLNAGSDEEIISKLRESEKEIKDEIAEDFKLLFNRNLSFQDSIFYYDDPDYRQCETAIIFYAYLLNEQEFQISFECLIDFNRILLKIKNESEIKPLEIAAKIRRAYNSEGVAEFKEFSTIYK